LPVYPNPEAARVVHVYSQFLQVHVTVCINCKTNPKFNPDMLERMLQPLRSWWSRRSSATQLLPKYLWKAVFNHIRSGYGPRQAAALSYYALFSVFPLILLLAVAIGALVEPAVAQEQIARALEWLLPSGTVGDIQEILSGALRQSSSFGLVATLSLIWAATGLFTNITLALDNIFEVPYVRSMWRQRLLAIIMGLTLVILFVASFVTSGVLRLIAALSLAGPNFWVLISTLFLPLGLNLVIFALLFRYVPAREVHWDAVWPAAIFGALGWELAKRGFEWYLTNLANYSIIYGSIATGIVLLFWAWLIASIFLFGAQLCARLNEWISESNSEPTSLQTQQQLISLYVREERLPPPPVATPIQPESQ